MHLLQAAAEAQAGPGEDDFPAPYGEKQIAKAVLKVVLAPVFLWAAFVTYGYVHRVFLGVPLPAGIWLLTIYALAQAFIAAAVIAVIYSYPIALVYDKHRLIMAAAIVASVLAVHWSLGFFDLSRNPLTIFINVWHVVSLALFLWFGTEFAHNRLLRRKGLQNR